MGVASIGIGFSDIRNGRAEMHRRDHFMAAAGAPT